MAVNGKGPVQQHSEARIYSHDQHDQELLVPPEEDVKE